MMDTSRVEEIVNAFDDSEAVKFSKKDYSGEKFVKGIKKMKALKFKSADKQIVWIGDNIATKLQNEIQKLVDHKDLLAEECTKMEKDLKKAVVSARSLARTAQNDNTLFKAENEALTGQLTHATEASLQQEDTIRQIKADIQAHTEQIEALKVTNVDLSGNLADISTKLSETEALLETSRASLETESGELEQMRADFAELKEEKEAALATREASFNQELETLKSEHQTSMQELETTLGNQLSTEQKNSTEALEALQAQSHFSLETASKAHEVRAVTQLSYKNDLCSL
jgi:chromosome segregation protein